MATRRTLASAAIPEKDATSREMTEKDGKSIIKPVVPASIIYKLLFFTFAMIIAPIGVYFLSLERLFNGNSTYAGATAAITANVVLAGYIIVAMLEDQGDQKAEAERARKSQ